MKVLIAGGGIGGLTAALCCRHWGHEVQVLEKASELGDIGAGIQIPPNAMKVFEALGIDDLIAERAFRPEYIEARMGQSGRQIFTIPLANESIKRWGSPYYHIHRADYISALLSALEKLADVTLTTDIEVTGFSQNSEQVCIEFSDGTNLQADVLIGADGIHSSIQTALLGEQSPTFTGNVAWRAVVPMQRLGNMAPAPSACVWVGPGRHCVTYQLRGGELANLVAVVERDNWTRESWTEQGSREQALADFSGWHPSLMKIIEEADTLYQWALFDRPPLEKWTDRRVALLGDAAHPMLPFQAQGAAMAVEDAWALAAAISGINESEKPGAGNHRNSGHETVEQKLKHYEAIRRPRASKVQALSRANARIFHRHNSWSQLMTYGPMWLAGKLMPTVVHGKQDYLYGYDISEQLRKR